ncbi:hypothetical protein JOF28_001854 [Leucobacter exalbidus]|uniref:Uncharacterized protein n=1 Tax=Leucobacter exalbidus TaxID=662960 RepID=A0A940PTJ8_9MICO|nr:hypothetical protein [Leucobacter exalbidus]MBP1326622.1 hypothetical protein [Leucobacter exalbidus]
MMLFSDEVRSRDHDSDPAHTPGDGWVGEGGASHLGPATHTGSAHVDHDDDEPADDDGDTDTDEDASAGE